VKLLAILSACLVLLVALGCSNDADPLTVTSTTPTPVIVDRPPSELDLPIQVAVTLPIFEEFARAAGRENIELISLVPPSTDPHLYQLTSADLGRMRGIDFFFFNGLGLDPHIGDLIEANRDEDAYVIPFASNIRSPQGTPDLTAEVAGDNAHLWLDPNLAYIYAEIVADEFIIYDGIRTDFYNVNFNSYRDSLLALTDEIRSQIALIPPQNRTLLTYHDSFAHFGRRFELTNAGFLVSTPGEAPSQESIDSLAQTVEGTGVPAIFAEYGYDATVMQQIATRTGAQLCTLYSDIAPAGVGYTEMMRANAAELVRCLAP